MSSVKPALKKAEKKNITKKRVRIDLGKNIKIDDSPDYDPKSPRTKNELWEDPALYEHNHKDPQVKQEKKEEKKRIQKSIEEEHKFLRARKSTPILAATIARGRFKTGSPRSPRTSSTVDVITALRTKNGIPRIPKKETPSATETRSAERKKGIVQSLRESFSGLFRKKKGGKRTRKNKRN
jgi:hypothetical protein